MQISNNTYNSLLLLNTQASSSISSSLITDSDSDGDGLLSSSELGVDNDTFTSFDSDEDGYVSESELSSALSSLSDSLKNGELDMETFVSTLKDIGIEVSKPSGGKEDNDLISSIISKNDGDEDGSLSSDELDIDEELFSALDTDSDGVITKDELSTSLDSLFESASNDEISQEELDDTLAQLGATPPPPPPPSASNDDDDDDDEEDETSSVTSTDTQSENLSNMISSLFGAIKNDEDELSEDTVNKFMKIVNSQTQDDTTNKALNSYLSNNSTTSSIQKQMYV